MAQTKWNIKGDEVRLALFPNEGKFVVWLVYSQRGAEKAIDSQKKQIEKAKAQEASKGL
jgi:hypothetical protein